MTCFISYIITRGERLTQKVGINYKIINNDACYPMTWLKNKMHLMGILFYVLMATFYFLRKGKEQLNYYF